VNCLIWQAGEILFQESQGYQNIETREPLTAETIFRISSMTKPITSVLAMKLWEEGKFALEDPIANWFPSFDEMQVRLPDGNWEPAHRPITVLDLLTHRAGFTYSEFQTGDLREAYRNALGPDLDSPLSLTDWVTGLASLPLVSHPGEVFQYGRSTDLLGILIATVEGKPLSEVLAEKILQPLGMVDTFFDVPADKKHRCAANFGFDATGKGIVPETVPLQMAAKERPSGLEYQSGGQGLWSTMADYLKVAKLFVQGGSSDGVRILQPETVQRMCSNQLTPAQRAQSTLMGAPLFQEDFGFGLGLAVAMRENPFGSIPCAGKVGSVGWPGAYGGWWSADPAQQTIAIFLTHSMAEPTQLAQGIGFDLYEAIGGFAELARG
jgi:CubicO group peptidase (beta-lactamase class C family)